jgi:hypothetical protein
LQGTASRDEIKAFGFDPHFRLRGVEKGVRPGNVSDERGCASVTIGSLRIRSDLANFDLHFSRRITAIARQRKMKLGASQKTAAVYRNVDA